MNSYEIIKELAKQKKLSIRQLEMNLGYSNGYLAKWRVNTPNSDELSRIADYFNVSVDYLLGRELKEAPKKVDLSEDDTVFSFDGKEISKETMRKAIAIAKALEENK
ncbi:TPA: helix-turn-helix transcriptional regulator [Enterococcus faecalis]|nr:helix-turn-helix transcriptional regulator [Enterococcus faecalis]